MSSAPGRRRPLALLAALAVVALAGCGGGGGAGTSTATGGAPGGAVSNAQLAEKIGLVADRAGGYRLGSCTAKAVLASPGAIERAKKAGKDVVTDPTGRYGIEIEDRARCAQVMEEAVAILNVP